MRYSLSVLNVFSGLVIIGCLAYAGIHSGELYSGRGFYLSVAIGIGAIGVIGFLVDVVMQLLIHNKKVVNIIGAVIALLVVSIILISGYA